MVKWKKEFPHLLEQVLTLKRELAGSRNTEFVFKLKTFARNGKIFYLLSFKRSTRKPSRVDNKPKINWKPKQTIPPSHPVQEHHCCPHGGALGGNNTMMMMIVFHYAQCVNVAFFIRTAHTWRSMSTENALLQFEIVAVHVAPFFSTIKERLLTSV